MDQASMAPHFGPGPYGPLSYGAGSWTAFFKIMRNEQKQKKCKNKMKKRKQQLQTMLDRSVIFNCTYIVKKRGLVGWARQHTTSTSCQNAACSNELFSLTNRLSFGGKRFD